MKLINTFSYEEKQSKFLVYRYEVLSETDAKEALTEVKKANRKADHVLRVGRYPNAYGIFMTQASEDKEPISSMKKTAQLLEKKDIRNAMVFIVRYFGGVKFGASYLDKVYFSLALKGFSLS
ncbi:MAG: YigZ family protein [Bacilli bacterium]|jgi:putative IMPACT (imprinted ancient) family translation regulator|nr:YigZ family protein [Bacilli bacterium]